MRSSLPRIANFLTWAAEWAPILATTAVPSKGTTTAIGVEIPAWALIALALPQIVLEEVEGPIRSHGDFSYYAGGCGLGSTRDVSQT